MSSHKINHIEVVVGEKRIERESTTTKTCLNFYKINYFKVEKEKIISSFNFRSLWKIILHMEVSFTLDEIRD